jgi:fumarylacetoacetate (FAA) hydrolase family protein
VNVADVLPTDGFSGTLVGRIWLAAPLAGPRTITVREDGLFDLSRLAPTLSDLFDLPDPARSSAAHAGERLCSLETAIEASVSQPPAEFCLLAPCDLQALKAAGVTFAASLVERVIEERAKGDPAAAAKVREELRGLLGDIRGLKPGSREAAQAKILLQREGLWSQYLEVGIGPDAEVFTKGQPLSAVGFGAQIGLHPKSVWNNPEPEIVLACSSRGEIVGASLGNDVNLRDFEGRSALLLGKAKDNNASCAIGPFVRLFDASFGLDDVRAAELSLVVEGEDNFRLEGRSSMAEISRDPADLVAQTLNETHQYPDGLMLFLGTLFAPTQDREAPGEGFTHKRGDRVTISSAKLGALFNRVTTSDAAQPWTYGVRELMRSLAARDLI